ncbi:MAG TPA: UbiA family prenyltransferase [Vicinamibacteria bacterium]|nr:UbiA family prenyltransferase [Vicinamibacteria bacterium]
MSAGALSAVRTSAPAERGMAGTVRLARACIRFDEVLVLQGTPLLGAVLALGTPTAVKALTLALFAAGSCCLVAHVFVLNDWAGMNADLKDPNRPRVFAAEGVPPRTMGWLSVGLLAMAALVMSPLGVRTLALALAIAGLSALYSLHRHPAKGVPVVGSLLHLAGGVLHFHLGYLLFAAFGWRSLALSAFFALTFAAGHLTQEVRDYEADLSNGIRTNAVGFGRKRAFLAGVALFTLADALLVALAVYALVPRVLALVAAGVPLHLVWSRQALRAGLTFECVRRLRRRYRWLYGAIGALMLVATVART